MRVMVPIWNFIIIFFSWVLDLTNWLILNLVIGMVPLILLILIGMIVNINLNISDEIISYLIIIIIILSVTTIYNNLQSISNIKILIWLMTFYLIFFSFSTLLFLFATMSEYGNEICTDLIENGTVKHVCNDVFKNIDLTIYIVVTILIIVALLSYVLNVVGNRSIKTEIIKNRQNVVNSAKTLKSYGNVNLEGENNE